MKETLRAFIYLICITLFTNCSSNNKLYKPEGNLLIERGPYKDIHIYKNAQFHSKILKDSSSNYGNLMWMSDSTFLTYNVQVENDSIKKSIVLLDFTGKKIKSIVVISEYYSNLNKDEQNVESTIYFSDIYPKHECQKIFYVKNTYYFKTRKKLKEFHVYNMDSNTDELILDSFDSTNDIIIHESPWSSKGAYIAYFIQKPFNLDASLNNGYIIDVSTKKVVKELDGYKCCVFSPRNDILALTKDNNVYLYDIHSDSFKIIYTIKNKYLAISSIHWSPNGENLFLEIYTLDRNVFSLGGRYSERLIQIASGKTLKTDFYFGVSDPSHWSWK